MTGLGLALNNCGLAMAIIMGLLVVVVVAVVVVVGFMENDKLGMFESPPIFKVCVAEEGGPIIIIEGELERLTEPCWG